jgi:hypothetical protein
MCWGILHILNDKQAFNGTVSGPCRIQSEYHVTKTSNLVTLLGSS